MKKSLLFYSLSGLMALAGLTGCEEKLEEPINPAKAGDEINFGISSNESAITRTIYDDEPITDEAGNTYYRVTWEPDGSDQIAIYCPQAQGTTLCNYSVTPNTADPTKSSAVTKVNANETGLLWGNTNEHHFFGFYPASAVTGTEDGKIRGHIPVTQTPTEWKEVPNEKGGKNIYGKANTDYAFMWAYGKFNRIENPEDYNIPLTFHPWVTILEIKIPGPAENTGNVSISNINIRTTGGNQTILTGDFTCDMNAVEDAVDAGSALGNIRPTYEAVGDLGAVRNTISIPCYREGVGDEEGDFVTLTGPNDTLVVHAYLLPYSREAGETRQLQVRVSPVSRPVLTLSLNTENGTDRVEPYKVNTVILPPVENREGNNYWLSSLDENIYLSELSIPGSYNSVKWIEDVENNVEYYQSGDISAQFDAGARAFFIGTFGNRERVGSIFNPEYSYYLTLADEDNENTSERFTSFLSTLHSKLAGLPADSNEFAFVIIGSNSGGDATWLQSVEEDLNDIKNEGANNQYGVYTEEITPDTRIADVKGKIVLKFNTNNSEWDDSYIAANAQLPAMFTLWVGAEPARTDMRWGSPNTSNTANLIWYFQEVDDVNSVGTDAKIEYIYKLFDESISMYENGDAHNTWFFNCISGREGNDALSWTKKVSPDVTQYLQARTANASLGLVYMNHVNEDYSQNILQTIIDNNFKFELRKAGN